MNEVLQDPCDKEKGEDDPITIEETVKGAEKWERGQEKCVTVTKIPKSSTIDSAMVGSFFKIDESKPQSKAGHTSCCTYLKQSAILVWLERIILTIICVVVAGAFTVPIIIYGVDSDRGSGSESNSTITFNLDIDNCADESVQVCQSRDICDQLCENPPC